jgi:hypothetical protein
VRQGHPASAFYFILSGSVVVMVTSGELQVAKPMAYLVRGMTFGVSHAGLSRCLFDSRDIDLYLPAYELAS